MPATPAPVPRIFDDVKRTDATPAYDTEDSFHFLNRAAGPHWQRVRELVDTWFADYPSEAKHDLRSRFREAGAPQHYGAWWELYVYTLYRRLGYDVQIHPTLQGTTRQPDFLVTRGEASAYVECAVYLSRAGATASAGGERSWIFEATNRARNPNFMVDIEIRRAGKQRPKASEIIEPLEQWLAALDPDAVSAQLDRGFEPPQLALGVRGWEIEYGAFPVDPDRRGVDGRMIAVYPPVTAFISNDMSRFKELVRHKGGRYGTPDKALTIAILNTSGFSETQEVTEALFGSEAVRFYEGEPGSVQGFRKRDGYWRQGPPPRGTRVSSVLVGQNISPWRVTPELPSVWVNPWADIQAPHLPLITRTAHDSGEVYEVQTGEAAHTMFGLDQDWPGFPDLT
ncbi:hypothetical protein ACWDUN_04005 [Mycobacterium sp. NPDC003323]